MKVINSGSEEILNRLKKSTKECGILRLMKYCYVFENDEGVFVYNSLTSATVLLVNMNTNEFIGSAFAKQNFFSVDIDFDEEEVVRSVIGDCWQLAASVDRERINALIECIYSAYIREAEKQETRKELYTPTTVSYLKEVYGSPFYIFRKDDFIRNYRALEKSFGRIYKKYKIAYSYKTNYTPAVCSLVKQLGGLAEVVSDFELEIARKIGYKDNEIIYNGPCKGPLLRNFILNNGILNIDSITELKQVVEFIEELPNTQFEIGLRLNFPLGGNSVSRFGIDTENGDLEKAINMVNSCSNLHIAGIHFHNALENIPSWKQRVNRLINIIDKYFNGKLKYIDLGSGMHIRYKYDKSIPDIEDIRTLENYAQTALKPIAEYYRNTPEKDKPILFTEPGNLLVKDTIDFLVEVQSIKNISGKQFIVVNGSNFNMGNEAYSDYRPIYVSHNGKNNSVKCRNADIVGYTCKESDKLYIEYNGNISVGDFIVFADVGAYSYVQKPPFIEPDGAIISIDDNKKIELVKKRETYNYLLEKFVF